ncbi:MAG TPA: type II toxin-antitoxin system RelE/ParE family toxin [Desulfobaccales bacterium]
MNFSVRFHPDADAEINEAAAFLDIESPGLGLAFLDDLEHAIEVIVSHPVAAPILRGRLRRKVLRKFPYSIIYSIVGEEIRILAVYHQRRRPFYWHPRR